MPDRRSFLLGFGPWFALCANPLAQRVPIRGRAAVTDLHGLSDENTYVSDPPDCGPLAWNHFVRTLIVARGCDPPYASRLFGYLALAQACAATDDGRSDVEDAIARAASSTALLRVARPNFRQFLEDEGHYDGLIAREAREKGLSRMQVEDARRTGGRAAERILERMALDRADEAHDTSWPKGVGLWRSDENRPPVRPMWGEVRAALVNTREFELHPPPEVRDEAFRTAIEEVAVRSARPTEEERNRVFLWADAAGTSTPAGHWNRIACRLAEKYQRSDRSALDALTLASLAMFDAGILCWRTKYAYWFARPHDMNSSIHPLLKVPNFPSYPSGHSAFSSAAATVLGHFYPEEDKSIVGMATDASESRIIAGLHYRFDCEEGVRIGRWVAKRAIALWQDRGRFGVDSWLRS